MEIRKAIKNVIPQLVYLMDQLYPKLEKQIYQLFYSRGKKSLFLINFELNGRMFLRMKIYATSILNNC